MNTIYVHSSKRTSGSVSDFTYPIQPPVDNITGVEFEDYIFMNSVYTVQTGNDLNRLLLVRDAYGLNPSLTVDVDIAPGTYNATDLAAEIKNALNDAPDSGFFNVVFDSLSHTFTITNENADFTLKNDANKLWPIMGFPTGADLSSTAGGITSTSVVDLARRKSIYVFVDGVKCDSQQGDGVSRQIGFKILLDKAFPEMCIPSNRPVKAHYNLTPFSLSSINVSLRDENGRIIDASEFQYVNWEFSMVLYRNKGE